MTNSDSINTFNTPDIYSALFGKTFTASLAHHADGCIPTAWRAYLTMRTNPPIPDSFSPVPTHGTAPVLWGVTQNMISTEKAAWLNSFFLLAQHFSWREPELSLIADDPVTYVDSLITHPNYDSETQALLILGTARVLPLLQLNNAWFERLSNLLNIANISADEKNLIPRLLLNVELPFTLAYLFPELQNAENLILNARHILTHVLCDIHDGTGIMEASSIPISRVILASFIRCALMNLHLQDTRTPFFTDEMKEQLEWLVRGAIQVTRPDGSLVFSRNPDAFWTPELFNAAMQVDEDFQDREMERLMLPGKKEKLESEIDLPEPASHSPWASVTIMRNSWDIRQNVLTVAYPETEVTCELLSQAEIILSGNWDLNITFHDEILSPLSSWIPVCWESDSELDYLEMEIQLTHDVYVQRQFLLARADRFLLLADTVIADVKSKSKKMDIHKKDPLKTSSGLHYASHLPLGTDVQIWEKPDSREIQLSGNRFLAQIIPLALPEWREQLSWPRQVISGSLEMDCVGKRNALLYNLHTPGSSLYAPVFLDLDPQRVAHTLTWRALTVAEKLEKVGEDRAAAFRIQLGESQWLLYRSLRDTCNRTFCGHNLISESFIGHLDENGEVSTLMEVKGEYVAEP